MQNSDKEMLNLYNKVSNIKLSKSDYEKIFEYNSFRKELIENGHVNFTDVVVPKSIISVKVFKDIETLSKYRHNIKRIFSSYYGCLTTSNNVYDYGRMIRIGHLVLKDIECIKKMLNAIDDIDYKIEKNVGGGCSSYRIFVKLKRIK